MQRHVNDWVGALKAAIPYLETLEADNIHDPNVGLRRDEELANVLQEAKDIVAVAEGDFVCRPKQPQTLVQELAQVINRRNQESGSDTPDFILADYLGRCLVAFDDCTKQRTKWYGLESFSKSAGITKPEFKSPFQGVLDAAEHFHKATAQQFTGMDLNDAKQAIDDYYKTRGHWEADALLKRLFPHGGVVMPHHVQWCNPFSTTSQPECGGDFEARKQASKPITDGMVDRIIDKRKEAGREIMEDIEKSTSETLHGFKKSFAYVPADLLEEFNRTNAALAKMWNEGQRTTQEYKDLQKKANELAETMNKVKKEAIEKEAGDKMARIVADATQVTEAFVKASKAIQVFNKEAKEAEAIRKKTEHMEPKTGNGAPAGKDPITDEKGFLFVGNNGLILWALHDGSKYCFCRWEAGAWIGWRVSEADIIEAGHTRLPLFLDHFVRSICPTK
jgi:hypothetical protein